MYGHDQSLHLSLTLDLLLNLFLTAGFLFGRSKVMHKRLCNNLEDMHSHMHREVKCNYKFFLFDCGLKFSFVSWPCNFLLNLWLDSFWRPWLLTLSLTLHVADHSIQYVAMYVTPLHLPATICVLHESESSWWKALKYNTTRMIKTLKI